MATIRKHRNKWQVQVRRIGSRAQSKSFNALRDAHEWGRQMEIRADRKDLPENPDALKRVTLGQLVERYRDSVTVKKRSFDREVFVLNAFLAHAICTRHLSDLRTADFASYRDERLREVKPATVKRQLAAIHHLFEVARDGWGFPIRENPLDKLKLNGSGSKRERRLKEGELKQLLDAARVRRNKLVESIIILAVETAMRRGEILAARGSDVDRANRCLLIQHTKNGQARTIPLTAEALAVLLSRVSAVGHDKLFPMTGNAFRLAWERVKGRAGITDLHFHDLRHEAISRLFERGLTVPEVALISGHRDMRMLFRYSHPTRERVLEKLAQCWWKSAGSQTAETPGGGTADHRPTPEKVSIPD
jgi:integrase